MKAHIETLQKTNDELNKINTGLAENVAKAKQAAAASAKKAEEAEESQHCDQQASTCQTVNVAIVPLRS